MVNMQVGEMHEWKTALEQVIAIWPEYKEAVKYKAWLDEYSRVAMSQQSIEARSPIAFPPVRLSRAINPLHLLFQGRFLTTADVSAYK